MNSMYMPMLDETPDSGKELQIPLYAPLPPSNWHPEKKEAPGNLEEIILIIDPNEENKESERGVIIIDLYSSSENEYLL